MVLGPALAPQGQGSACFWTQPFFRVKSNRPFVSSHERRKRMSVKPTMLTPLWWDDASYAHYQADGGEYPDGDPDPDEKDPVEDCPEPTKHRAPGPGDPPF